MFKHNMAASCLQFNRHRQMAETFARINFSLYRCMCKF